MSIPPESLRPPPGPPDAVASRRRFVRNLIRVLSVQVVTLLVLWLLQARYGL